MAAGLVLTERHGVWYESRPCPAGHHKAGCQRLTRLVRPDTPRRPAGGYAWPDTEPIRQYCGKCGWYHVGPPCG